MPVLVKTLEGWRTIGVDSRDRGVAPEDVAPVWDAWGPLSLGFTLQRDPTVAQPDLAAFSPILYAPPGQGEEPTWGGFIFDTPASGDDAVSVSCRGHAFLLDDDPYCRVYAHDDLAQWVDMRTFIDADLNQFTAGWNVELGAAPSISYPGPHRASGGWPAAGLVLDLGPDNKAKRVVIDWTRGGLWAGTATAYLWAGDTIPTIGSQGSFLGLGVAGANSGTATYTLATPRRYVVIFVDSNVIQDTAQFFKVTRALVTTDAAYESGNVSVLKSSDVIKYALSKVPDVDQATGEITTTATSWLAFGTVGEDRTARVEMERANDLHQYLMRFTPRGRLQFRPRLDRATLEVSTRRAGVSWVDSTVNSGEGLYNKVVVRATGAGGVPLTVTRLSTDLGIRNLLDRRGHTRTKVLEMPNRSSAVIMQALADAWLMRYARTPLKGTLTIEGRRAMRDATTGAGIPAPLAGTRVGEMISLSNLYDPDTGATGRPAITVGASYDEEQDVSTVAIDNQRDDLDALFARNAVISGDA